MTIRVGLRLAAVLALVLAMGLLAACGDDDDDDDAGQATVTTAPTTPADQPTPTTGDEDDDDDNGDDEDDTGDDDVEAGRQIAGAQCFSCHTTDGSTGVGPTWQGLYNSEVELESGETVTADEDYLRESILDPNAKIHAGFPPVMPSFEGQLTDEQIDQIIEYIKSLE